MIVVSNTTPILSLLKIGCLNLLEEIFEEIFISEGVFSELTAKEMLSDEIKIIKECKFIKTIKVKNEFAVKLLQKEIGLDLGESESIVLANELNANVLLIDERKGRKIAQSFEINISGTLGILLKAKELNYIDSIKPYLDKLIDNNIRISPNLYDEILKYSHEI